MVTRASFVSLVWLLLLAPQGAVAGTDVVEFINGDRLTEESLQENWRREIKGNSDRYAVSE